jgi:hypothetical protein
MEEPTAKQGSLQCWFFTKMEDQEFSETLYEKWLKQHKDKQAFDYNPDSKFLYYNLVVRIMLVYFFRFK